MYHTDMKYYTVAEFRKNMKEALDRVVKGEEIYIERLGQEFKVVDALGLVPSEEPLKEEPPKGPTEALSVGDALDEIKSQEKARDEELEHCQDPDTRRRIEKDYQETIDALWAQYHELKGTT